jgi:hypothetical protein
MLNDYNLQKEAKFLNQRLEEVSRHAWKFHLPKQQKSQKTLMNLFTFKPMVKHVTMQKSHCVDCTS